MKNFAMPVTAADIPMRSDGTVIATTQRLSKTGPSLKEQGNMKKQTNRDPINAAEVVELLYQALETEKGGVQIYTTALRCAINEDLRKNGLNISSKPNSMCK
jgi:hypothetical protein